MAELIGGGKPETPEEMLKGVDIPKLGPEER
jgi:hypothetical protein